jgi:hypothetical protein
LHQVLRVVVVAGQPARQVVGGIQEWQEGLFEPLALLGDLQQRFVSVR